jgi:sec-independent protein translocase protein TatB
MPQIGWFELIIIVIIAILVIGPKDFPIVLNKVGSWIGTIKSYFSEIQRNVNKVTDFEDTIEKEISDKKTNKKNKNEQ